MPKLDIKVGGRNFEVACQEGEEALLQSAAAMLDAEARTLSDQIGRMPEAQMLLMAGLMLADRTVALEERVRTSEALQGELRVRVEQLENRPPPEPERIEVPVVPPQVAETLAELAARAEAIAQDVEEAKQQ